MIIMFVAFLVAAFAVLCVRVPSVWLALMATDEPSDARELSLVVASRASSHHPPTHSPPLTHLRPSPGNPFRESGPPHKVRRRAFPAPLCLRAGPRGKNVVRACSHAGVCSQLNQANTRKRRTSANAPRTAPRQFALPVPRQRAAPWIRMPKHFGMQHH